MMNKRLLAILLVFIMLFSMVSCKQKNPHINNPGDNSHDNNDLHNDSANQQHNDASNQGGEGKVTYVYSILSKTLHLPSCYHAGEIKEDYRFEYTGYITELLEKGYTICKDCLVPDKEEEEPEDDTNKVAKEDATFVINSSSKALHMLDCHHIKEMEEKNVQYTDLTLEELIELDIYKPCGFCLPDEYKEYMEKHPDKK